MHNDLVRVFEDTLPSPGLHLLDTSAFWNPCGGVRRVLSTKHDWLVSQGWRHTVMAPGADGIDQLDCGGLPLPGSGGYRVVLQRERPARLIELARPDLVEAADPYTLAWSALAATQRLRVPAVAFCHSDLPAIAARLVGGAAGTATRRGRFAALRARRYLVDLYQRFDLVLAPSQVLAERLRSWGLNQVMVQPLGVDCQVFRPAARDAAWRQRLCQRLGLAPRTRLLAYTGRFAPEKNLPLLAAAVRRLGPGHALLAVGAGPQPPRGSGVHVLPPERDSARLARLLASCDAYVHAGDQETFGLGALEAMACGTPVVVSAAGGLGELAQDVGLTVARPDSSEWAESIQACLNDIGSRRHLLALAKAREHDWAWVMAQLSRRYLALLRRHALGGQPGRPPAVWGARPPSSATVTEPALARLRPLHPLR